MNNTSSLVIYLLCGLLSIISVLYFIVAFGEYSDWMELLEFGIQSESGEKIIEITLFLVSGFAYIGLVAWILKVKMSQKFPYFACILISAALIITYIASRTIGVPIVGTEFYVGRIDWISKIIQIVIIGLSGYILYNMMKSAPTQKQSS